MINLWWKRRQLQKNGYTIIRGFFSKDIVDLYKSFMDMTHLGNLRIPEKSHSLDGEITQITKNVFDDSILLKYQPMVEKYFNRPMIPSYIFTREYFDGSSLKIHRDRGQCQYSVSVTIYKTAPSILAFCDDEQGSNPIEVHMEEGDAIIFNGSDVYNGRWHYRPPVEGGSVVTAFLHYVDIDNNQYAQEPFPLPGYRK